mmetsp:Transcript_51217/g.158683  ORF Transcript_51217/g.158683 Transcript_51217/m.158683 type:complete len:317 (+) Transcript_51217:80-1030(+)
MGKLVHGPACRHSAGGPPRGEPEAERGAGLQDVVADVGEAWQGRPDALEAREVGVEPGAAVVHEGQSQARRAQVLCEPGYEVQRLSDPDLGGAGELRQAEVVTREQRVHGVHLEAQAPAGRGVWAGGPARQAHRSVAHESAELRGDVRAPTPPPAHGGLHEEGLGVGCDLEPLADSGAETLDSPEEGLRVPRRRVELHKVQQQCELPVGHRGGEQRGWSPRAAAPPARDELAELHRQAQKRVPLHPLVESLLLALHLLPLLQHDPVGEAHGVHGDVPAAASLEQGPSLGREAQLPPRPDERRNALRVDVSRASGRR